MMAAPPPPLPPKSKKHVADSSPVSLRQNIFIRNDHVATRSHKSAREPVGGDVDRQTINFRSSLAKFTGQRSAKVASAFTEPRARTTTWADERRLRSSHSSPLSDRTSHDNEEDDEFFYQNVSNGGTNYIEYKLNGFINKGTKMQSELDKRSLRKTSSYTHHATVEPVNLRVKQTTDVHTRNKVSENGRTRVEEKTTRPENRGTGGKSSVGWKSQRSSQIQVHQVENRTVVKISVNDHTPTDDPKESHFKPLRPVNDLSDYQYPEVIFKAQPAQRVNEYAEPFATIENKTEKSVGNYQRPGQVYANVDKSKKKNRRNEPVEDDVGIYENSEVLDGQSEQFYANVANESEQVYANVDNSSVDNDETAPFYHNVKEVTRAQSEQSDEGGQVYANVNTEEEEEEEDQVYENQEFEVLKNSTVTQSVIERYSFPETSARYADGEVYENGEFATPVEEKSFVSKKELEFVECSKPVDPKNVIESIQFKGPVLKDTSEAFGYKTPQPCVRVTVKKTELAEPLKNPEPEAEMLRPKHQYFFQTPLQPEQVTMDEGQYSPSDTFDSGTCSDLDIMAPPIPSKKKDGKYVVTISNSKPTPEEPVKVAQEAAKKRQSSGLVEMVVGHRRAESQTSSGVGIDSESDGEGSISCDSLNSNELNALSTSEDHGYHTPNSDNKAGSPLEDVESPIKSSQLDIEDGLYENPDSFMVRDEAKHHPDIIQQVADVAQRLKHLRTESAIPTLYMAKRVESTVDLLENYNSVNYSNKNFNSVVDTTTNLNSVDSNKKNNDSEFNSMINFNSIGNNNNYVDNNIKIYNGADSSKKTSAPAPPPPPVTPPKPRMEEAKAKIQAPCAPTSQVLPKGLLHDIRSRNVRLSSAYPKGERPADVISSNMSRAVVSFNLTTHEEPRRSVPVPKKPPKVIVEDKRPTLHQERTYEERKTEHKTNKICAMEVDTDQFYKFHLFENKQESSVETMNCSDDETFAGVKDYLSRDRSAAITSAKGTIRGVKNRVKAGIATFLQMQETKTYKDKDAGKIVVYATTMGIVRETYHKCLKVKQILRTLMVKFEERDVFMSTDAQDEIRERIKSDAILIPQVFVEGQHIGDAETIERLNESGELRKILKPYKSPDACVTCQVCGGYRLLPCQVCKGSKKSVHRNHFTAEFVSLKCMNCDQVGLTRCYAC